MKRSLKTILALVLALAMVLVNILPVAADDFSTSVKVEDGQVYVWDATAEEWVLNAELTESMKLDGSIEQTTDYQRDHYPEGYPHALSVVSDDTDASFEVTGDTAVQHEVSNAYTVYGKSEDGTSVDVTIGGNVEAEVSSGSDWVYSTAVNARADGKNSSTSIEVKGNVNADTNSIVEEVDEGHYFRNYAQAQGISASSAEGTVTVNVGGNVTATATAKNSVGNSAEATAVSAASREGGKTTVEVEGKAVATASADETEEGYRFGSTNATAVKVLAMEEGSETDVTVGKGAEGKIYIEADTGSSASVTVENGGVTADGAAVMATNAQGMAPGAAETKSGSIEINITGDVTSGTQFGNSEMYSGGFTNTSPATIQLVSGNEGGTIDFTLTGNVNAAGEPMDSRYIPGVTAGSFAAVESGELNATITGEIVSENTDKENGYAVGLEIRSLGGEANTRIDAAETNAITATGGESSAALVVDVEGGSLYSGGTKAETATTISYSDITDCYIYKDGDRNVEMYVVEKDGKKKYYVFAEDVEEDDGIAVVPGGTMIVPGGMPISYDDDDDYPGGYPDDYRPSYEMPVYEIKDPETALSGSAVVDIKGDVTSDGTGVELKVDKKQKANVIVDGTVAGDRANIVLVGDTQLDDNVTLTVWQVVPDENDAIIYRAETDPRQAKNGGGEIGPLWTSGADEEGGEEADKPTLTADKESEKKLQYIIRVEDKTQQYLASLDGAKKVAGIDREYDVAKEGETVTMKLNIPEGYEITEAYGDVDKKVKLEKDANGNYFLTVPRGGGVYLAVTLTKIPDPEPEPEPDEPDTVAITYILGNDTQYDHIRTTAAVGEGVALHPAPERDGYTFLYWQCTDVDPNSSYYVQPDPENDFQFRPGAIYTASKDINFVAVWQKN